MKEYKPVVLVILDGWGETSEVLGNPFQSVNLPTIKELNEHYPKTLCQASGISVGLPWGICGNSEVGHQTIGTGQIIYQNLLVISLAIKSGDFFENKVLKEAFQKTLEKKSKLHLMGLLSDGGVHSHIEHILALLEMAKKEKIENIFLHLFSDGRDAPTKSFAKYFKKIQEKISELKIGQIATVMGRFYGMDRNKNWERTEKAFLAMTQGEGIKVAEEKFLEAVEAQYAKGVSDEFLLPMVSFQGENMSGKIENDDAIIFFNFRKDRARQIAEVFVSEKKENFWKNLERPKVDLVAFANYEEKLNLTAVFSFPEITAYLGQELAENGKKQLRIAETEKYAHVTYFFNGGIEKPFEGEERILIESKKVDSYDQAPEMSADEITERLLTELEKEKFDFILVNYANPDMVGHTGNLKAAVKALEKTDECLKKLIDKVLEKKGCLLITADHGNVEEMINLRNGEIDTEHSLNPVPFWLVSEDDYSQDKLVEDFQISGMIMDITPTILELLNIKKNPKMSGESLLEILRS